MNKNLILCILLWLAALSDEITTIFSLSLGAIETNPVYPFSIFSSNLAL